MKKIFLWMMTLFLSVSIIIDVPYLPVRASEESSVDIDELLGDVREKLSNALSGMDDESLKSEDGIKKAISEGEEKFGVDISEADAKRIVETMEKLEDLGFSGEYVIDKAQELYNQYGADFLDHADEVIKGAVQNAVTSAADNFFHNLWESAKNFFKNLFSGL